MFGPLLYKSIIHYFSYLWPLAMVFVEHTLQQSAEVIILGKLVGIILLQEGPQVI